MPEAYSFINSGNEISNILFYKKALSVDKTKKLHHPEIPIWKRTTLSLEEAAEYSGIGIHKLRELANMRGCRFVLWNGNRRRIKRKLLDEFLENADAI